MVAFVHLTSDDLARMVGEALVTLWELPEGLRDLGGNRPARQGDHHSQGALSARPAPPGQPSNSACQAFLPRRIRTMRPCVRGRQASIEGDLEPLMGFAPFEELPGLAPAGSQGGLGQEFHEVLALALQEDTG